MKLNKLVITAFGPFADKEVVDFSVLGDNALFLIDGPTGAGKSSILHAVCFALYGETTDKERKDLGLRSDYAKSELLTSVELTFSVRGKNYRIIREPTQNRPKKSGEGFTVHQATAHLVELLRDGKEKTLVAKKKKYADEAIKTLVGLTADQFRQVMVLPQGKFRELLLAKSDDRQQILSTLFQTQIYRQIEDELKSRASEIEKQNEEFERQISDCLHEAQATFEDELNEKLTAAMHDFEQADKAYSEQKACHSKALSELEEANRIVSKYAERDSLLRELDAHKQGKPQHEENEAKLRQAKIAKDIESAFNERNKAFEKFEKAKSNLAMAALEVEKKTALLQEAESAFKKFEPKYRGRDGLIERKSKLAAIKERTDEIAQQEKEAELRSLQASKLSASLAQQEQEVGQAQSTVRQLEHEISHLEQVVSTLPDVSEKVRNSEHQLALAKKRDEIGKSLDSLKHRLPRVTNYVEGAQANYSQAKQYAAEKERAWYQNQASYLASGLVDEQPCPVCGSKEHPNPAPVKAGSSAITKEQVEQARKVEQDKRDELERATNSFRDIQRQISESEQELMGVRNSLGELAGVSTTEIQTRHDASLNRLEQVIGTREQVEELKGQLSKQRITIEKRVEAKNKTASQLAETNGAVESLRKHIAEAQEKLSDQPTECENVTDQIAQLTQQIAALDEQLKTLSAALEQAKNQHIVARQDHANYTSQFNEATKNKQDTEHHWNTSLQRSPFNTEVAFTSARLTPEQLTELEQHVQQYDKRSVALSAKYETLSAELKGKEKPDIEVFNKAVAVQVQKVAEAEENRDKTKELHSTLTKVSAKIASVREQQKTIRSQYEVIGKLSKAASGRGNVRVTLERFVLGILLDQVLEVATQRLLIMSKGQYYLERLNEVEQKKNATAGLDLAVFDLHSGKSRPVQTLSGGESFMASLSLALALSEVVQQRAGGIQLDTLFVDEGFGSLDQESLQQAINTLVDLQSAGRTIGIISHVSELKQQMHKRIDVINNGNGSTVNIAVQ